MKGRLRCAVLVAAWVCAMAGCGSSHSRYQGYIERGRRYLAAGNLDKASVEFRNALQIEPRSDEALYLNGRVAERRGNLREAVQYFQSAIDVEPKDARARAGLAKLFVLAGAGQRALEVVSPGLLERPDDPDLLAARAAAFHELKDDFEARRDAERAVRLSPANENAISVLAALDLRAGETDRAITLVHDAVAKTPDSIELHRILASVYLTAGQPQNAVEQMRQVIRLEPNEIRPRVQLANYFVQLHQLDPAQQTLEQAVKDLSGTEEPKLALVAFLNTERSHEAAQKALRNFIDKDPDNDDLRLALGGLQQGDGATADAIATYREVIRRSGTHGQGVAARDRLAALEIGAGHEDAAKKLIAEVLEKSPHDDDALIMRANLSLTHGDPTSAVVDLRAVLHDQPRSVVLQRALARAYVAKGQPALAEETLRTGMEAVPEDASLKIELAQLLIQTDRTSQAVSLLEGGVQHAPDDIELREALIRAYRANHDLETARRAAEELKTLRPDTAAGYHLAGLIAHDQNRFDDSEKNLERAYQLQPGSIDILASLTRFSLERGRRVDAVKRLQVVSSRDPGNAPVLDLLGRTCLEINDLTQAQDALNRSIAIAPRAWATHRDLARVKLAQNDPGSAITEYRTALQLAPTEPVLVTELASLYEKMGRVDEAVGLYEKLLREDPNAQQLAANNLAMLLATYRTDAASLDRARALTARFDLSDNASLLDTAGWVHLKRHEYQEAVAVLERAADRFPDSATIRSHLEMARTALTAPAAPRVATPSPEATPRGTAVSALHAGTESR
jgi:tetratricopeptide (TPR) repeat protein